MPEAPLDPQELAAIQDAIRESKSSPSRKETPPDEVSPLALIADDRAAERARPFSLKLAETWVAPLQKRLRRFGDFEVAVTGAEVVDGEGLRDELASMWTSVVGPSERSEKAIVAIGGPLIESLAIRLLGAEDDESEERPPTSTAIRVFAPAGRMINESLSRAWSEIEGVDVVASSAPHADLVRRLIGSDVVIAVTLTLTGAAEGRIRLLAKPSAFVAPIKPAEAVPAPEGAIAAALGEVEVMVDVELGRTTLTMSQLRRLRPGTVLTLDQFIDDPLPVRCCGVVKAHGTAVVARGVLGVQVVPSPLASQSPSNAPQGGLQTQTEKEIAS